MYQVKKEEEPMACKGVDEFLTPPEDWQSVSAENFRDWFLERVKKVLAFYGGSEQYLANVLDTSSSRDEFKNWLLHHWPRDDSLTYQTPSEQPPQPGTDFIVHVSDLGFDRQCSTKLSPDVETCKELADEIVTRGFVTEGPNIQRNNDDV